MCAIIFPSISFCQAMQVVQNGLASYIMDSEFSVGAHQHGHAAAPADACMHALRGCERNVPQ